MNKIKRLFTQHPQSIQESYFQHLKFTLKYGIILLYSGIIITIHGIFPFLFLNTTRDLVSAISDKLLKRNPNKNKKNTHSILEYVGNTPLLQLNYLQNTYPNINLYGKCEFFNPTLSVKDRIVLSMLRKYEESGILKQGTTIYEASSGNTGTSLAMIGKKLGYDVVITVPKKTSQEKINSIRIFGATVIVSNDVNPDSPEHYVNKAKILCEKNSNGFYFNQYGDLGNPQTHYCTTATEIWEQANTNIDYVVCAASSGGTITGIAHFLKEKNPKIKIILADPIGSVFYDFFHDNTLHPAPYAIEGAGKDQVCSIHDFNVIDDVIQFNDDEAFQALKKIALTDGLLVGGSSGGSLAAAEKLLATIPQQQQKNVIVLLPDSGFKYLSKIPI